MTMKIRYNAPFTLSFALLSVAVLLIDQLTNRILTSTVFAVGATMNLANPLHYLRLFLHIVGHGDWAHLMSNMAFILLLGPILEEKYGSKRLFIMVAITALVTGILNVVFFPTGLLGASGVVFMMILLVSFTNIRRGEIPLTFILVVLLYLTQEIIRMFQTDQISQFAHIIGGLCGSIFGFLRPAGSRAGATEATTESE